MNTMKINSSDPATQGDFVIIDVDQFDPETMTEYGAKAFISREDIAVMKKADVAGRLEAHGVEFDGRSSVSDLREMLTATMFADI